MSILAALWAMITGGFKTLIGSNSEARADFVAINDAYEAELKRVTDRCDKANDRCDRMQVQLDHFHNDLINLRGENADLRVELNECNGRHDRDELEIASLKSEVTRLQGRVTELESKSNGGMGS